MNLTDRAKQDFEKWYYDTYIKKNEEFEGLPKYLRLEIMDYLYKMPLLVVNAYQIAWMDSIGWVISVEDESENRASLCSELCERCESCYDLWITSFCAYLHHYSEIEENYNDYDSHYINQNFRTRDEANSNAIVYFNNIYNSSNE